MTILYINDEYCFNINQLRQLFELPIKYGSPLFKDILDYGRAGDIARWLREHNECNLADSVDLIKDDVGDGEYMSQISDIITGNKVSNSKPEFSKLFSVEDIKINESEEETVVCVYLKNKHIINESYELMIRSSWGTRATNINPVNFKKGIVIKQEFHFRKRPNRISQIELYADGIKLKSLRDTQTFQIKDCEFRMIFVEHGEFEMGKGNYKSKVRLTDDYYMGEVPVTQKLWRLIMNNNPSRFERNGDNRPVECVTWDNCHIFLAKLNKKLASVLLQKKFRLPTEAEWEFAARGGNASRNFIYSGSNELKDVGWCNYNSRNATHEVATLKPNELGLFDMSGNVCEMCKDTGTTYIIKGGSYRDVSKCKLEYREVMYSSCHDYIGLRLCLS